ncbi:hypothetical protein JG687_00018818 [Phytophthora cactorum]|uniref:Uncharacterized protein n=1 Tax=Phytophthora cactorum TaxID=29920 RepID=A0A8T1TN37_9STRA|nr:hypothetical protein JG687_00018818 [Phytophthora cactorum]
MVALSHAKAQSSPTELTDIREDLFGATNDEAAMAMHCVVCERFRAQGSRHSTRDRHGLSRIDGSDSFGHESGYVL